MTVTAAARTDALAALRHVRTACRAGGIASREFQIKARTRQRPPRLAVRPRRYAGERPRGQGTEGSPGAALTSLLYGCGADGAAAEDAATAWFEAVLAELDGAAATDDEPPS